MRLAHTEWGDPDGPPLICLHGVGECRQMWRRIAQERWGRSFRVIALDLRGHGDSTSDPPWTHETHVDDVLDTMAGLGIERSHFIGHSFGGRLVLRLVERTPERVMRAVVTEPVIKIGADLALRRAEEERVSGQWNSLDDFVASRQNLGAVDPQDYLDAFDGHFESTPDGRVRRRTCQSAVVSIFGEFAAPAPLPETITVPTLLLYSPAFGLVTPEQVAAYTPHVAKVVTVPGLHTVLLSAFEETAAAVEEFLCSPS